MEYSVVYSSRRTLALQVKADGRLIVRAPFGTSDKVIAEALLRHGKWIENAVKRADERKEARPEPSKDEEDKLVSLAKNVLPERVAYYSKIMGVTPTHISVTRAKTRFGSCSGKNAVSFSCRLMLYPPEAVDYVVVHELAHIRHHNHSAAFWREVEKYMPDYRLRQRLLK